MSVAFQTATIRSARRYLLIAAGSIALIAGLWQIGVWSHEIALQQLEESSRQELHRYVQHLQGQLEKYEILPGVLATNKRLVHLLQNPGDSERIEALNRYLETVNKLAGTSDTYLMDEDGLTIAASNWASERPFVGRNFSYRPYFQEALKGNLGRYFALGTTSNRRGYYFAYPVRWQSRILGAVVIKIDMTAFETSWGGSDSILLVTDPDGVIFITSEQKWRYRSLDPLAPEAVERIRASRRYGTETLERLPVSTLVTRSESSRLVHIGKGVGERYLVRETEMPQAGWRVHILSHLDGVESEVLQTVMLSALLLLAVFLLILHWLQRFRSARERARYERQAKSLLELRVREQTRDITEANVRLMREIEQHRQTESQLQRTQSELIQSAKLAVIGQMSTGISHELNQPLAAIRSYADNARALFRRDRIEDVEWNLVQISELTERMAQISSQLKQFARKTAGRKTAVSVAAVVADTLRLLASRIKQTRVGWQAPQEPLHVAANMVQFEQVLVNLVGNALQAVEQSADPRIEITARSLDDGRKVAVEIRDNGEGVPEHLLERIFDPFFTTKREGQGLGLGLSISLRIIEAMGGQLSADNHPDGGAVFSIVLEAAVPPEEG
jgi:two-component system C4-dicarboxylate transport sensor histidine kinase DctB